jgi:hypothetical protein
MVVVRAYDGGVSPHLSSWQTRKRERDQKGSGSRYKDTNSDPPLVTYFFQLGLTSSSFQNLPK